MVYLKNINHKLIFNMITNGKANRDLHDVFLWQQTGTISSIFAGSLKCLISVPIIFKQQSYDLKVSVLGIYTNVSRQKSKISIDIDMKP